LFGGDILIVDSSINENKQFGAFILPRRAGTIGDRAIVNSHFDNNGGTGISLLSNAIIISSTANGNIGFGLLASSSGSPNVLVWDSEFSDNDAQGVCIESGVKGSVINSLMWQQHPGCTPTGRCPSCHL
jgi:hypothetical protein